MACQVNFFDYMPDLEFFGSEVLPLMRQAGLRADQRNRAEPRARLVPIEFARAGHSDPAYHRRYCAAGCDAGSRAHPLPKSFSRSVPSS